MNKKIQSLIQLLLLAGILIFINIFANYVHTAFDLTEDQRFTLTPATKRVLESIDDPVYVKVLLTGDFSKGFKRLQRSTREMLDDFKAQSGYIEYVFEDPYAGSDEAVQQYQEALKKDGITPTRLSDKEISESSVQYIYPWAIVYYKGRTKNVNLLENQTPGVNPEVTINNSIGLLEYKLADAIQKVKSETPPVVAFTASHGELNNDETSTLENAIRSYAATGRLYLDSVTQISQDIDLVIVAKPTQPFSEKDKFKIDQYVMNGGKIMWLIDRMNVTLDSLVKKQYYVPTDYPLNIEDLLFRYGIKIEPNLVLDLESSRIPQVVGESGGKPQFEYFRWYYHPIVASKSDHPIVKSLDRVNLFFPSGIDTTVTTKLPLKKTVLLESSPYTRTQYSPVRVNFQILAYEPDPDKFNKPPQIMAALLEGKFTSLYQNRVTAEMNEGLEQLGQSYKATSVPTQMIVVSDGDVARNEIRPNGEIMPLGYNPFERYTFANALFLTNCIDYLLDNEGVIEARGREVKLRLLDKVKAKKERPYWQLLNIGVPLLFLTVFGILYNFWRRKKYGGA